MRHRFTLLALLALILSLVAAGCGGGDDESSAPAGGTTSGGAQGNEDVSGKVSVMGIWTGDEQKSFQAVIDGFNDQFPNVTVKYNPAGDNLPTILGTAIEGGNPPDIAAPSQPGFVSDLAKRGELKTIDFAEDTIRENFGESALDLGSVDGKLYALFYKANNKATVWYNVQAFADAGVEPPETWDDFLANAETLKASGVPAYSIGAANGWTLTDLFENIYLQTAGADMYDKLATHEIPWTDQSVKDALTEMAKVVGDSDNIAGGTEGALQTDFDTSVTQVYSDPPKAAQVIEADFVADVILGSTKAKPETDFDVFDFPQIGDAPASAVTAGNLVILLKDNPAAEAFIEYLATPEAAEIWAQRGGFSSPNKNVEPSSYANELTRRTAIALAEAEAARFDLSDLQPAEFGGTEGQGLWKLFQDFVANSDDVDGIAQQMEDAAAKAYK